MTSQEVIRPSWFGPIRVQRGLDVQLVARPRWKVRGRRGYYRSLRRTAERFTISLLTWYDFMHWHADWYGIGNLSWRDRRQHLEVHVIMLRRLLEQSKEWPEPHQCWLRIDPYDSAQDALFLHTRNPNADNFPCQFDGIRWDAEVPERLRPFLGADDWQFGQTESGWTLFFVRPRPVG